MIVKTIMKGKARGAGIVTVSPDASVGEAARLLAANRIGALVAVEDGGAIAGMLSERDIVRGLAQTADSCLRTRVRELMTADVQVCRESDTIEALMQIMTGKRIRHLPVVDESGQLIGIVTIGDVVKSRLDEASMEVDSLRHYVMASR